MGLLFGNTPQGLSPVGKSLVCLLYPAGQRIDIDAFVTLFRSLDGCFRFGASDFKIAFPQDCCAHLRGLKE